MAKFNTGNPVGSSDPRDLYDNSKNLDEAVNSDSDRFTDRLGKLRPTLKGAIDPTGLATSAAQDADRAEIARDAAFVNADVYPDIATGLAAVADGEQFQVLEGDLIVRYKRMNSSTADEVARYPSGSIIEDTAPSIFLANSKTAPFSLGVFGEPVSGASIAANTYLLANPFHRPSLLSSLEFYARRDGTLKVKHFDTDFNEITSVTLSVKTGLNSFEYGELGGFSVDEGNYVGFYSDAVVYLQTKEHAGQYRSLGPGDLTSPDSVGGIIDKLSLQIKLTFSQIESTESSEDTDYRVVDALNKNIKFTRRLGQQSSVFGDGTQQAGYGYYAFLDPVANDGEITAFRAFMAEGGSVKIAICSRNLNEIVVDNPTAVFYMPAGFSEKPLKIKVKAGDYIAVQSTSFRFGGDRIPGLGVSTSLNLDGTNIGGSNGGLAVSVDIQEYPLEIGAARHIVDLNGADSISLLSNSYGEAANQPLKKTWLGVLSQITPWNFNNYSVESQDIGQRLASIRAGTTTYYINPSYGNAFGDSRGGMSWRDYKTEYALIVLAQNSAGATDLQNDLHDALETCKATGARPILITESENVLNHAAIYRQMAERYGGYFVDVSELRNLFPVSNPDFNRGTHLNYRTAAALYSVPIARALQDILGGPRESLKFYRPRPGFVASDIQDFMFEYGDDLRSRFSERWQEIAVGARSALDSDNEGYMDALSDGTLFTATSSLYSEYLAMQLGQPIAFTDYALISATLNAIATNVKYLKMAVPQGADVFFRSVYQDSYPAAGGLQGAWVQVPVVDNSITLDYIALSGALSEEGRIDFLIRKPGDFVIQSPKIEWWGKSGKVFRHGDIARRPIGPEAVAEPFMVDTSGGLHSGWSSSGVAVISTTGIGGELPVSAHGDVLLTGPDYVEVEATFDPDPLYSREVEINVWAASERELVDPDTYPIGASMTGDSWDGETLAVDVIDGNHTATSLKTVLPFWSENRVRTILPPNSSGFTIRVRCESSGGARAARCSCRLV
jgi:hypothetical protein